jgi:hypothetical protein
MQEICLGLMGKKMLVALMMEGKFSGEGLQSLDVDEDLMSAMARELVEKGGVGESADQIWRQIDHERSKYVEPVTSATDAEEDNGPPPGTVQPGADLQSGIDQVHWEPERKRKGAPPWPSSGAKEGPVQLSLFG